MHPNEITLSFLAMFTYWILASVCVGIAHSPVLFRHAHLPLIYWCAEKITGQAPVQSFAKQTDTACALQQPLPGRGFSDCLGHRDSFHLLKLPEEEVCKEICSSFTWSLEEVQKYLQSNFWNFFCPNYSSQNYILMSFRNLPFFANQFFSVKEYFILNRKFSTNDTMCIL